MQSKKKYLEVLRAQLENERATFLQHWRDLGDFILPRRPRFTVTDANKGDRRNQKIVDSTATFAARTLRSGMMGGVTSPARPWFRLTVPNFDLAEQQDVKLWLHGVTKAMESVFIKSNLYNTLPQIYGDLGTFGTAAMYMEEDLDDVVRFYAFPVGSYYMGNDDRLRPRVFMRDFRMTVRQLVEKFGKRDANGQLSWDNFSTHIKSLYDQGLMETWIDVAHVIKPNEDYNPQKPISKNKRYMSCYYERGMEGMQSGEYADDRFLSESGYDYFPVLLPRWEVTGEDVYGTDCPGMVTLGDTKALQMMHKRKAQAIEKMVNPPMTGPTSLKNQKSSILPGDITYVDSPNDRAGFRPAHEVNPRIQELLLDIQDHQSRIRRGFYEDLFLMLANSDRRQITAREIDERHEEKLLALGPVLEQLNQDLLDPLIDITFNMMIKQDRIPPPPDVLSGMDLKVEYISIMAQAQKAVGLGSVERFLGFAGQMAQLSPTALDKVDVDQAIDLYGEMTSVPPSLIRSDEDVAQMRAGRQQAQQEQAQMEQMAQGARAVRDLANAPTQGGNALSNIAESLTPGGGIG